MDITPPSEQTPLLLGAQRKPRLPRRPSSILFCKLVLVLLGGIVLIFIWAASLLEDVSVPTTRSFNATSAYLSTFYNTSQNLFYKDTSLSLWNDFWMEAIAWEVVMDAYIVYNITGGSPAPSSSSFSRPRKSSPILVSNTLIDAVYDGFMNAHDDMSGVCNSPPGATNLPKIKNPCNDDVMWWARASARAYEITGKQRYLLCAQRLFDHVWTRWDSSYGGGIRWGCLSALRLRPTARPQQEILTPDQKNVATNAPSAITAVKLSRALNDKSYLDKAVQIYTWLESSLANATTGYVSDNLDGGELRDWQFTYNYGTMVGASVALYTATNNATYLAHANLYANTSFTTLTQKNSTILRYEGTGDAGGFAGIYIRHLYELQKTSPPMSPTVVSFLGSNAEAAYKNRRADGLMGGDWEKPAPQGVLETHDVGSAVVAVLLSAL